MSGQSTRNPLEQRLADRLRAARLRIDERAGSVSEESVDRYIALLDEWPPGAFYGSPPTAVLTAAERVRDAAGVEGLALHHQTVLVRLIERSLARGASGNSFAPAWEYLLRAYVLILGSFELEPPSHLDWSWDNFCKDVNVALLRMLPTGTMVIERRSAFSRRAVFVGGARGVARGLAILRRVGGHAPLYEQHLYTRFLTHFTPAAWVECLRCTVELLRRDTVVRGVFGGGWLWDPALEAVSPRVAFLRAIPAKHGAVFIPLAPSVDAVSNALVNAPERRAAYEAGDYQPRNYMMIWPRSDILAWGERNATGR